MKNVGQLLICCALFSVAIWAIFFAIYLIRKRRQANRFDKFINSVENRTVDWNNIVPSVWCQVDSCVTTPASYNVWDQVNESVWKQLER